MIEFLKKVRATIFQVFELRYYLNYKYYRSRFRNYLVENGYDASQKSEGEDEYIAKWRHLSSRVEVYSYRFFAHYMGKTPYIVPENIGRDVIEETLNPLRFRPYYKDKNIFSKVVGKEYLPIGVLSRVLGGQLLDSDLQPIGRKQFDEVLAKYDSLVVKPSVDTSLGRGVMKFDRTDSGLYSGSIKLDYDFLMSFGSDFIVQKTIVQSLFMKQFCPTSVNTMKLGVYRSVIDDTPHVICGVLRMGRKGDLVDNSADGGHFVGIDIADGTIGNQVFAANGHPVTVWNDIDYAKERFVVPNWGAVIKMAEEVSKKIPHLRLLGLDVTLDEDNNPILVEYNLNSYSYWYFMYTGHNPLGEYTDEIIAYCKKNALK